ncbi:37S ribosomal protein S22, partial [Elasticomyces elasticus]
MVGRWRGFGGTRVVVQRERREWRRRDGVEVGVGGVRGGDVEVEVEGLKQEGEERELGGASVGQRLEDAAREARLAFGETLPEGFLSEEAYRVYERLYGPPLRVEGQEEEEDEVEMLEGREEEEVEGFGMGTGILQEGSDGRLEEVEFDEEEEDAYVLEMSDGEFDELTEIAALDDAAKIVRLRETLGLGPDAMEVEEEGGQGMEEDNVDLAETASDSFTTVAGEDIVSRDIEQDLEEAEPDAEDATARTHPLTIMGRFATSPSAINLPKTAFVKPVERLLADRSNTHLESTAHRVFGGLGLPYSPSTPTLSRKLPQKPIALDAYQGRMAEMEADVYMAAVMPGVYASVMSAVVETRKRLGSEWLVNLMTGNGDGPRILDAGGAGAGILAVREVLKAEWQRTHEETPPASTSVAAASGKTGGASIDPPLGKATVLTASDALRHRASQLLENTTFLPRLPDYLHASDPAAQQHGKFDIIVAPHSIWPIKEEYLRKAHVLNLWSLLAEGGVLVLLEKGVPRGFEIVAAAREMLLEKRIARPGSTDVAVDIDDPVTEDGIDWEGASATAGRGRARKGKGMIIAPCTNHAGCPMYQHQGISKGRKDYCHFEQRYVRPPFLQKLLGAKDRNHEDVAFSYLSVMRGRDPREHNEERIVQGPVATDRAFRGYEHADEDGMVESEMGLPGAEDFFNE